MHFFSSNVFIIKKHQFQELALLPEAYRWSGDGLLVTSLLSSQTSRSYHGTWYMDIPSGVFATQNLTLEPHPNWYLPVSHLDCPGNSPHKCFSKPYPRASAKALCCIKTRTASKLPCSKRLRRHSVFQLC